jgi:hypothetical protein
MKGQINETHVHPSLKGCPNTLGLIKPDLQA